MTRPMPSVSRCRGRFSRRSWRLVLARIVLSLALFFSMRQSDSAADEPADSVRPVSAGASQPGILKIDGMFDDWADVPSQTDPAEDTHSTRKDVEAIEPRQRDNPDCDLLEFKLTHDAENLYAYFRARGRIGRTQKETEEHKQAMKKREEEGEGRRRFGRRFRRWEEEAGQSGRYYVILTIDVDQNDETGYWLHEGGYYPSSRGYDVNAELEWFDGEFNTGHYLNHGAKNEVELEAALLEQTGGQFVADKDGPYPAGTLTVLPGTYKYYTQWVYHEDDSLTLVRDKGPSVAGIVQFALSEDGRELEVKFPFKGFLKDKTGQPIIGLGRTIDVSFSLESSGELAPSRGFASDTGAPIEKYVLTPVP